MPTQSVQQWTIYQPLIVGLGAVILGLVANTLLEWFKQRLTRKNEARALRAALLGELRTNRDGIAGRMGNSNDLAGDGPAVMMVPIGSHVEIYMASISKLGLLDEEEIFAVVKCYEFVIGAPKNLGFLGKICGDDYYRWIEVDKRWRHLVVQLDKETVVHLDNAIQRLSIRAAITDPTASTQQPTARREETPPL